MSNTTTITFGDVFADRYERYTFAGERPVEVAELGDGRIEIVLPGITLTGQADRLIEATEEEVYCSCGGKILSDDACDNEDHDDSAYDEQQDDLAAERSAERYLEDRGYEEARYQEEIDAWAACPW